MKNRGKRLALFVLVAALLAAVLAGSVFAAGDSEVTVTNELRGSNGALQITGTAANVQKIFVAAYDDAGRMTGVHEASGESWSVSFTGERPARLRIFAADSGFVPEAEAIELRPALQVGDKTYWTMAEAEAAAATNKTITVVNAYYGPAASEGYTVVLGEKGDFNNGKAFLTEVSRVLTLNYSGDVLNAAALDGALTRLTAAYLLTDAARLEVQSGATVSFTDVEAADAAVVAAVVNNRMMSGTGATTFMPENTVTTEEAALLVCRCIGLNNVGWKQATLKLEELGIADAGASDNMNAVISQREFIKWLCKVAHVEVGTEADFRAALEGKLVQSVRVTEDVTLTGAAETCVTVIKKPVTVAAGRTLTVAAFVPEQGESAPRGFLPNFLIINRGGSLTLERGAVAATTRAHAEEPWYLYRGQINVEGGELDASAGSIGANSFLAYADGEMTLPDDMENVQVLRIVSSDVGLREGMTNDRYAEVMAADNIVLENDLTLTKLLTVQENCRLTVPAGKTLTVPADGNLSVNGDLLVQGTLRNYGSIDNNGCIDVIGGRLENAGEIIGEPDVSIIGVEKSGELQNYIGEKKGVIEDEIDLCYYYPVSGEVGGTAEAAHIYTLDDDPVMANCVRVAVTFSKEQAQEVLNMQEYVSVIYSGTNTDNVNRLDLGGLTVPNGQTLTLKGTLFDGTNTYQNRYIVSAGTTLRFEGVSGMLVRADLDVRGSIVTNADTYFMFKGDLSLGGKLVDSAKELAAALEQGGEIYLAPFPEAERVQVPPGDGFDWESQYILTEPFTVSRNTRLIPLGRIGVFAQGGFTVDREKVTEGDNTRYISKTLTLDNGLFFAVQANSTVNGILDVVNGSMLRVCQPDGAPADAARVALTVYGDMSIGTGEDFAMLFIGGNAQLNNGGTVQVYDNSSCIMEENAAMVNVALFQNGGYMEIAGADLITDNYFINFGTLNIREGFLRNLSNFINRDRVTVSGGVLQNEGNYCNGYCYIPWIQNPGPTLHEAETVLNEGGRFRNAPTGVVRGAYDEEWGDYISCFRVDATSGAAFLNYQSEDGTSVGRYYDRFETTVNNEESLRSALNTRYNTVVVDGDVTVNGNLTVPDYCSVIVPNGSSLTVTGSLTLGTSHEIGWMESAGSIEVEKGGSLKYGSVQYTGEGGVFSFDEGEHNNGARLILSGLPLDCADEGHPTGMFGILQGNFTLNSGKSFTITDAFDSFIVGNGSMLTVNGTLTNKFGIENRGVIYVKEGTLFNNHQILNNNLGTGIIAVGGRGTFVNTGYIEGDERWNENGRWFESSMTVDPGAHFTNTGTIMDRVQFNEYVSADGTGDVAVTVGEGSVLAVPADKDDPGIAELHYAAVVETTPALKRAKKEAKFNYDIYLPIGAFVLDDNFTVPKGRTLLLQAEWTDDNGTRANSLTQNAGTTLTINQGGRVELHANATFNGSVVNHGELISQGEMGFNRNVASLDALRTAMGESFLDSVTLTEDITINEALTITKPLRVTAGHTLTVSADVTFRPEKWSNDSERISRITVEAGGSLVVTESGKLTTRSNFDVMPLIPAEIVVDGGTLDASAGALDARIDYRSGTLLLPEDGDKNEGTEVLRRLYGRDCNEERLTEALNDARISEVWLQNYLEVNKTLTVNKTVKIWGNMDVNGAVTVVPGALLEVEQNATLAVNPNGSLTVREGGALVTITGGYDGNGYNNADGVIYVRGTLTLKDGASVSNGFGETVLHLLYDGDGTAEIGNLVGGTVEKGYIVFNQEQLDAALADPNISYLQINRGNDLVYNGDRTLNGGLRISGGDLTVNGDLHVTGDLNLSGGDLTVTGNLILNGTVDVNSNGEGKYSSLIVGGDLRLSHDMFVGGESANNGASVAVTGRLIKADDANVVLAGDWDDNGFAGYRCSFTASNLISDKEGVIALLTGGDNGETYYLTYFPGSGCYIDENITVNQDVTLNALDSGVWVELKKDLLVGEGVTLTIGAGLDFAVDDDLINNGTIMALGGLYYVNENYWGPGSIYTQASLRDLARTAYQEFGAYPGLTAVREDTDWYGYEKGRNVILNWDQFVQNCSNGDYNALLGMALLVENDILTGEHYAFEPVNETLLQSVLSALVDQVSGVSEDRKTTAKSHINSIDLYGEDNVMFRTWLFYPEPGNLNGAYVKSQQDEILQTLKDDLGLYSRSVTTEAELLEALNTPYVTDIHVPQSMTILGTPDGSDPNFNGCFYLNNDNGRSGDLNIYLHGETTLTVGDETHRTKLDIGRGVRMTLIQIEDSYAKVVVSEGSMINAFGELNVSGPWEQDDYFTGNIAYYGNAYWFSGALQGTAGQYMNATLEETYPDAGTLQLIRGMDGWIENRDFTVLVAYGLTPEVDDQGHSWWQPWEPLRYGQIRMILTNVYRDAANNLQAALPNSVAIGDGNWPQYNDWLSMNDTYELLDKFADALYELSVAKAYTEDELRSFLSDDTHETIKAVGVTVNGDLTIPEGKWLEISAANGSDNTVTVNGNLIVEGALAIGGQTQDKLDPNSGILRGILNVTGDLILRNNGQVIMDPMWGDNGFERYFGTLTAANVISKNKDLTEILKSGSGIYYLPYHEKTGGSGDYNDGGYNVDGPITVTGDVTLISLSGEYSSLAVNMHGVLTVNEGAELVIGQGVNLWPDHTVNNGTIFEFGNIDTNPENYSGSGSILYQRSIVDFAIKFRERFAGVPGLTMPDMSRIDVWNYENGRTIFDNWDEAIGRIGWDGQNAMVMLLENGLLDGVTGRNLYAPMDETLVKTILSGAAAKILPENDDRWNVVNGFVASIGMAGGDRNFFVRCLQTDPNNPNNRWIEWQEDAILDGFVNILDLSRSSVSTEAELMAALELPYVTEIRVTDNITLNGAYYWNGKYMGTTQPEMFDDLNAVYFFPAGMNRERGREIIVEPGATLTVAAGVKLDIQQNVKLHVEYDDNRTPEDDSDDCWGNLTVRGNINVFGYLEPNENDTRRITVEDGGWIGYYNNAYWFSGMLQNVAGQYMTKSVEDALDEDTLEYYRSLGWDHNPDFTVLVAYGLTPETDGNGNECWRPDKPLRYSQIRTILTNVYREAVEDVQAELPGDVSIGDGNWPHDNDILSDRDVEELLNRFVSVLPKDEATVYEFLVERRDCSAEGGNPDCSGGIHELVNGSHDTTIRNQNFTQAVTISNVTALEGDDNWGGTIRFAGCSFAEDITVIYNPAYNFRVEFDENCSFAEGVKVNVVKVENAPDTDLLANNNVTVRFDCAGGEVVSSARVDVEAANGVSFLFNGVTVSATGINNNSDFFYASMFFNCAAMHSAGWHGDDHRQCGGPVSGIYQFTAYGNTKMTVSGTTDENLPIHLAGTVDISGLAALENQEISLHDWNGGRNDVRIGSNSVTVDEMCENTRINGVDLSPHVFGRNKDGLFIGLQGATAAPAFTLNRWGWDDEQGDVLQPVGFTAEYFDESGNTYTGGEQDFDVTQMEKVHLNPAEGYDFSDHMGLVLTVNYGGGSVTFNGIWWKPIYMNEFAGLLNEILSLNGDAALTPDSLGVTAQNEYDYLTFGSAKAILSAALKAMDKEVEPELGRIIDDDNYWWELEDWTRRCEEAEANHDENWLRDLAGQNPDNWTRTWDDAERMLIRFRNALGMNSVKVTNAKELLDALAAGYTDIRVTADIALLYGEHDDGNFDSSVYFNRADGADEQKIYVQPGKTLTVGGMVMPEEATEAVLVCVKLDIQDGVRVVLCADENNPNNHGVLCVNKDSCVNVFGSLETPEDLDETTYNSYVVKVEGANVSYKKRLADFGGRLYERLRESNKVEALTDDDLRTPEVTDCWPDAEDEWGLNAISFLRKYAGLSPITEGDRAYWPSWDYARYGQVMKTLRTVYTELTGEDMPETVDLDWTPDDNHVLDDYGVDTLIDRFMDAYQATLPKQVIDEAGPMSIMFYRDGDGNEGFRYGLTENAATQEGWEDGDGSEISNLHFNNTVTVLCDPYTCTDQDDYVGTLCFRNCEFAGGVTVKALDKVNFTVDFTASCKGADANSIGFVTVDAPDGINDPTAYYRFGVLIAPCVTLKNVGGLRITANTFVHVEDVREQAFSLSSAAGTLDFDAVDNEYDVDVRWDYWQDGDTLRYEPTVQINSDEQWYDTWEQCGNEPVRVSSPGETSFNGKLRVCGYLDLSDMRLGTDPGGRIELTSDRTNANIALGNNEIRVYDDCIGEYVFTTGDGGGAGALVLGMNAAARISLNGVDLGTPYIVVDADEYIFVGTDVLDADAYCVEQMGEGTDLQSLSFEMETIHEGIVGTYLSRDGEADWFTDSSNVRLTVFVSAGHVTYEPLRKAM